MPRRRNNSSPGAPPAARRLARGGRAARARRARLRGRVAGPSRASGARRPGPTRPTARQPSPPAERRHVAGRDPSPVGARGPWLRLVGGLDLAQRAARRCSAATRAPLLYSTSSLHLCALIAPVYAQLLRGEIESAGKDAATRPLPGAPGKQGASRGALCRTLRLSDEGKWPCGACHTWHT